VQSSISRLETAQKLRRLPNSKVLFIDAATQAQVDQRAATAGDLERAVRDEWIGSIKTLKALDAAERQRQWLCLQEYLVRLLDRHGAETVQLLAPNGMRNPSLNKSIHSLRGEAFTAAQVTEAEKVIAEEATQAFFRDISPLRARYIAQLLDGMFSYFALSVDQATTAFLRKNLQRIRLFLDSNFILGILGLSSNFLVDVSQELLTLIKDQKLPFELYFHDETIKEIERVVYGIGRSLKAEAWTGEMSRAFVESGKLRGIELRFHELNAETPTNPELFLSRYDHLRELLKGRGFREYLNPPEKDEESQTRFELVAQYKAYVERTRPDLTKEYATLNHDIAVWMAVQRLRQEGRNALDVGSLFLTLDLVFQRFDWQELRQNGKVGSVVLPNHLLQLLRPFVPRTDEFNIRFAETLAIPEFRTSSTDYTITLHNVMTLLNTYAGDSEEIASAILANDLLLAELKGVDAESDRFKEMVESAVTRERERVTDERRDMLAERDNAIAVAQRREQERDAALALVRQHQEDALSRDEQQRIVDTESAKAGTHPPSLDARIGNANASVRNPWISGSFYLAALLSCASLFLVAAKMVSPIVFPTVLIASLLAVSIIGAFQLRHDGTLDEGNFLKLMALALKRIPKIGKGEIDHTGHGRY